MVVLTSMMMVMDLISIHAQLIFLWLDYSELSTWTKVSIVPITSNQQWVCLSGTKKVWCLMSDYRDIKVTPQVHSQLKGFLTMAKIC